MHHEENEMKDTITAAVLDALARHEVQSRWPSLKDDRIEENVALMRSDDQLVRTAEISVRILEEIESSDPGSEGIQRDAWRRAGIDAAAAYVRRHADRYVIYGASAPSIERHVLEMQEALTPRGAEQLASPGAAVRKALARDAVARGWPSLRADLVETNVSMMESERHLVRHAEIAVAIVRTLRHEADAGTAARDNRLLLEFQRGVEMASRYFVTLSAREWHPRTIGWSYRCISDDIKQRVHPDQ